MSIEDMSRKMAVRVFRERTKKLMAELRTLSLPERFRAVADFIEEGQLTWGSAVAREAMSDLEHEVLRTTSDPDVKGTP